MTPKLFFISGQLVSGTEAYVDHIWAGYPPWCAAIWAAGKQVMRLGRGTVGVACGVRSEESGQYV